MTKHLYCISGLGADERIFRYLQFPQGYEIHFVNWIPPLPQEALPSYAERLWEQVHHRYPVLLGMSFGGMMALEMAKKYPVEKIILLSSIKHRVEMPPLFRLTRSLHLLDILPNWIFLLRYPMVRFFMGPRTEADKILLRDYVRHSDKNHLRWALRCILNWENEWVPPGVVHVQGDHDWIFPLRYTAATHWIKGGTHFMVHNQPAEVSAILLQVL